MPRTLEEKNALVIGGAVGIGRAVCLAFAEAGANVVVADKGWLDEKEALLEELAPHRVQSLSLNIDVTEETSVAKAVADAVSAFGHVDIMVNNAGVTSAGALIQFQDWDTWDRIFAVNLKGIAFGMKHMVPHMLSRRYGRIINTSSQLAHRPVGSHGAYCASKAAVTALTASVAQEVAGQGHNGQLCVSRDDGHGHAPRRWERLRGREAQSSADRPRWNDVGGRVDLRVSRIG